MTILFGRSLLFRVIERLSGLSEDRANGVRINEVLLQWHLQYFLITPLAFSGSAENPASARSLDTPVVECTTVPVLHGPVPLVDATWRRVHRAGSLSLRRTGPGGGRFRLYDPIVVTVVGYRLPPFVPLVYGYVGSHHPAFQIV